MHKSLTKPPAWYHPARIIIYLFTGGFLFVFLFASTMPALAQTAPSVSSISGTPTAGSVMSINGSGLNQERLQSLDPFWGSHPTAWSFEGASAAADGFTLGGSTTGTYDSSVKLLGNKSMKYRSTIINPTCVQGIGQNYNNVPVNGLIDGWYRFYVRFNRASGVNGWPSNYMKMFESFSGPENYYFQPRGVTQGHNATQWWHYGATGTASMDQTVNNPGGELQNNRWYLVELHIKKSSPTIWETWIDNQLIFTGTPPVSTRAGSLLIGVINACGNYSWDVEEWWDGLLSSTQRIYPSVVVEVSNGTNYATATKKYQEPLYISDSKVDFKLDTTGLGSGPYYVFVTNNAQQRSAAVALTGGSSPPPPPPTPVAGDINLDHIVNAIDYSLLNADWFTTNTRSDLNTDGIVNSLDYSILNSNWFKTW